MIHLRDSFKTEIRSPDHLTEHYFIKKKKKFPFGTRKHFSDALHFYTGLKLYNVELLN